MKIQDILEDIIPNIQTKKVNHNWFSKEKNPRNYIKYNYQRKRNTNNKLGSGHFSTVRDDHNDPHMVRKHTHNFNSMDSYDLLIEYLIDNNYTNNPWFPRIYNIKHITDNNNKTLYTYQIEKLISSKDIQAPEWQYLINRTFNQQWLDRNNISSEYIQELVDNNDKSSLKYIFNDGMIDIIYNKKYINSKDDNLIQACKILNNFIEKYDATYDIHDDNIMYRRTKYGIQGVLSDPVA